MPTLHKRILSSAAMGLFALALAVPAAYAADVIKIGVTGPFSGPAAQSGLALKQGMIIAAAEWNGKGGVTVDGHKRQIKLLFEDTQDNPAQGVSAAQKLITDNKVNFVIGDAFSSSVTLAEMDLADQYKVPMMSCEPVSSEIPEKIVKNPDNYDYFWKADFSSDGYAATIHDTYRWLIKSGQFKPKSKSVAFVVEDTDYGRSIAALTADLFKQDGWDVISNNTVQLGNTNFNAVLTKLSYRSPAVLVSVFTSVDSGVALSRQFNELGLKASQFAIYYPTRPGYVAGAGENAEGLMWAPLIFSPALRPKDKALDEKVHKRFDVPATSDHAYGYDCVNIAVRAYQDAGTADSAKVAKALAATDYEGVLGHFIFSQKNHTAQYGPKFIPIPTAQIRSGKNVIIWPQTVATDKYQKQPWMQ